MRFYLDHDVDARCRKVLTDLNHQCWTASDAGNAEAIDDEQTAYAHDKNAVLITHDKDFTARRKRNAYGWHVQLVCDQPDGPRLLQARVNDLLPIIGSFQHVTIVVKPNSIEFFADWQ